MYLRTDKSKRTVRAPAKINLFLEVLGRRDDGFHDVETLMVRVRLWDTLSMSATGAPAAGQSGEIELTVRQSGAGRASPAAVPTGRDNLVIRALELLRERSGCRRGAHVELVKRIPVAAGLGGGSSDAAAALRLGNQVWQLGWPSERLAELAAELGSDVPFFLNRGDAVCTGRGERIRPLSATAPLHLVIVKPAVGFSTADVYRAHDSRSGGRSERKRLGPLLSALARRRLDVLRNCMTNRLQAAAATLSPWIEEARAIFDRLDCLAHQLSGSGSAYFGVCRHARHAARVATLLKSQQLGFVYTTRSCS